MCFCHYYIIIFILSCTCTAPITVGIKSKAGVNGPKEKEIPVQVKDNNDGTYAAQYTPESPGEYAVGVKYGGTEIPQSPISVSVVPDVEVGKIQITDLQESKFGEFLWVCCFIMHEICLGYISDI